MLCYKKTRCKCAFSECKSSNCSCLDTGLKCSPFCECVNCENQGELDIEVYDDRDESDDDDIELYNILLT